LWLVYRKMYLYFFVYSLLDILTGLPVIGLLIGLGLWIGLGLFGNYLYGKFTYEKLVRLKLNTKSAEELKLAASRAGGTFVLAVLIVLFILGPLYGLALTAVIVSGG